MSSKKISLGVFYSVAIAVLAIAGSAAAIYTSANGPWGAEDAATYIITARNLMRGIGLGYFLPNGHFYVWTLKPPLFSLLLAAIGRFGVDLVDAARWLNVLLFTATLIIVGLIFTRVSSSPSLSIPAGLLVVAFPTMVRMYSSSLSEPLFIALLALSVYFMLVFLKLSKNRWLIAAAVSTALLPMTRYIGVAMIPVGFVSLLLFMAGHWKERLKKSLVWGILSSLPIVAWEIWVYFFVDHSLAGRAVGFDRADISGNFTRFYSVLTQIILSWFPLGGNIWELRFRYRYTLIFLILAVVVAATLLAARRSHKQLSLSLSDSDFQIFSIWGLWVVSYVAFLAIDGIIATPNPPITNRILLPLFVGMALCLMGGLACWQRAWFQGGRRWLQVVPWIIGIGSLFWYAPTTINEVILPLHQPDWNDLLFMGKFRDDGRSACFA